MYTQAMSVLETLPETNDDPRVLLVEMAAGMLALARYPVIEVVRTCALHTLPHSTSPLRIAFNQFHASARPWTHEDRDVVTPANDFLYLNGWIDLSNGPVLLDIPAIGDDRYFVIELLDAFTNNFVNLSARTIGVKGGRFVLHSPGQTVPAEAGVPVECPTHLVWFLGRVLVRGDDDLDAARSVAGAFRLSGERCAGPSSVRRWHDTGDHALDFFQNVFNTLADFPPGDDEAPLLEMLQRAGVKWRGEVDVAALPEAVRQGLRLGYAHAQRLITAFTESRARRAWSYSLALGRYGHAYLQRACTAMKGLGALAAEEAVYAAADFDDMGEHLDGRKHYEIHFPPGQLPPVDAMWSVSLYGADRYFIDNPIRRYALGDRTPGLQYDADGGLRIRISHDAPDVPDVPDAASNWLPAPASGGFYLIMRFYHPQASFLEGRYAIPPVRVVRGDA
ncbi:DUF1254 domain-containing protein [Burkholderia guangdongensis]|uniref:DUF1254 domain-containing protein n=1 Tax=Burkholderia guangdongensis TaxID=1792500 RepID=UPI001FEC829E|nr:DUF1254 domain-containing protein [Burkholderia guangdongensis]